MRNLNLRIVTEEVQRECKAVLTIFKISHDKQGYFGEREMAVKIFPLFRFKLKTPILHKVNIFSWKVISVLKLATFCLLSMCKSHSHAYSEKKSVLSYTRGYENTGILVNTASMTDICHTVPTFVSPSTWSSGA